MAAAMAPRPAAIAAVVAAARLNLQMRQQGLRRRARRALVMAHWIASSYRERLTQTRRSTCSPAPRMLPQVGFWLQAGMGQQVLA